MNVLPTIESTSLPYDHFKFRGVGIPAEIFNLLVENEITPTEVILLALVDSAVDSKGLGCWMTNATLARYLGVTRLHVRRLVSKLKKRGLLIHFGWKKVGNLKFRILETSWSRVRVCIDAYPPYADKHTRYKDITDKRSASSPNLAHRRNEVNMPFIPSMKKSGPSNLAKELANIHRTYCSKKNWFVSKSRRNWSDQFQVLINQVGYPTLLSVLEWYHENHPSKIKLTLKNGKEFKDRYNTVLRLMENDSSRIIISPAASELAEKLSYLKWPKGSESQLPQAIQITLDNFDLFSSKLESYAKNHPNNNKARLVTRFAHYLVGIPGRASPGMPSTLWITEQWFRRVQESVLNWSKWSGNLMSMGWDGNMYHKEFTKLGKQWASWSSDTLVWDNLIKELA